MRTKYIVVEVNSGILCFEVAVCFPEAIAHADMARAMGVDSEKVISAGFFTTRVNSVGCVVVDAYGESVGLNKHARMEDSALIAKSIGTYKR